MKTSFNYAEWKRTYQRDCETLIFNSW